MQTTAHVIVNGEKIKVLCRSTRYGVRLKIRTSGRDGTYLQAESEWLAEQESVLDELKAGSVVSA